MSSENSAQEPLFPDLDPDASGDQGVTELESLCLSCREQVSRV